MNLSLVTPKYVQPEKLYSFSVKWEGGGVGGGGGSRFVVSVVIPNDCYGKHTDDGGGNLYQYIDGLEAEREVNTHMHPNVLGTWEWGHEQH